MKFVDLPLAQLLIPDPGTLPGNSFSLSSHPGWVHVGVGDGWKLLRNAFEVRFNEVGSALYSS